MELILGSVVCMLATFVVGGLGLLVVDPGGSVKRIRGESQARSTRGAQVSHGPAFEPLQLAEPPMRWPSGNPWPKSRLPKQPWPSETWPGDFFNRKGGAFASLPERPEYERPPTPEPERRPERAKAQERPKAQEKPKPKKAPERSPAPVAAPRERKTPDADEVIAWVQDLGLAGAVDKVRARTGWDFQEAAQYLAATLRDRREGR